MNQLRLRQCLGSVSAETLRRRHHESLIESLAHQKHIAFSFARQDSGPDTHHGDVDVSRADAIAHQAGVNCLAIDNNDGQYLFSGGADSTVRLWDLDQRQSRTEEGSRPRLYSPRATLSRSTASSHTHALTSISIYPFDPTPATLLTTSYDKTLKVTSITPTSLTPLHTFELDFTPYTHSLSPLPDAQPLIAVGTAHPAIRLLDLRSGLSTHSMSGANGAIYSIAWSPRQAHLLASGSADGRVLFFDIRRANAAFASLDLDDAVGVVGEPASTGHGARGEQLDFHAVAHNGPVTSVQWTPGAADKIVTAGHDQRIRVWDAATGRNDLVHFGPRIKNDRAGELRPLISPAGTHLPGREALFWPNDDARGFIFQHHLREGHLVKILRTEGVRLAQVQAAHSAASASSSRRGGRGGGVGSNSLASMVTSGGRINAMVWRIGALGGEDIEMYTAHGDGRIGAWLPTLGTVDDEEEVVEAASPRTGLSTKPVPGGDEVDEAENRKKRKRALIGDLVEGFAKRPLSFS